MTHPNAPAEAEELLDDDDLARFDEEFAAAEPIEQREFDEPPDGKYQVNVERVEYTPPKRGGKKLLKWTLRILNGPHANRLLWRNNLLLTPENRRWLKSDLHLCGLDLEKLSHLEERLHELLDVKLEVTKRTRGENTNIYLNKRIKLDDGGATSGGGSAGWDDLPF